MKITTFLSVNNENLGAIAPKFALFTKGSNLPLNKGFKNMFELLQSCAQPSICLPNSSKHLKWVFLLPVDVSKILLNIWQTV